MCLCLTVREESVQRVRTVLDKCSRSTVDFINSKKKPLRSDTRPALKLLRADPRSEQPHCKTTVWI